MATYFPYYVGYLFNGIQIKKGIMCRNVMRRKAANIVKRGMLKMCANSVLRKSGALVK